MAKTTNTATLSQAELHAFAKAGARAQLGRILAEFPDLGAPVSAPAASIGDNGTKRERKKMSAAARAAIGRRMKAYWAKQRKIKAAKG